MSARPEQVSEAAYTLVSADRAALLAASAPGVDRVGIRRIHQAGNNTMIRLDFAAGQVMRKHSTPASLIVQVLDGVITFRIAGETLELREGAIVHVRPGEEHELEAPVAASVLLTLSR